MATFTFFHEFKNNLALARINMSTDTFKWALTDTAPTAASDDELADITQIAAGTGYTAGGSAVVNASWAETGAGTGVWRFTHDDLVFTATGGSMGPFRYCVLYSDTSVGDKLIGYLDNTASVTITDGNTFTINVGASGVFELA